MTYALEAPCWDITDVYTSPSDPKIDQDLARLQEAIQIFRATYAGQLDGLDDAAFLEAIQGYERIQNELGRLYSYGHLVFSQNTSEPEHGFLYQKIQEAVMTLRADLSFFPVQILQMPQEKFDQKQASSLLASYHAWLGALAEERPHTLSEELEEKLQMKAMTSQQSWVRLFEETINGLKVQKDQGSYTLSHLLHNLMNEQASVRQQAFTDLSHLFKANVPLVTFITNTLAKDKHMEDVWRGYARADDAMNASNRVSSQVVDGLIQTVRENYGVLAHRYYHLKAKFLGQEKLNLWDRLAPLPQAEQRASYTWDQAQQWVLKAYHQVSPRLGALAQQFFDHPWIDAQPREGKDMGAFCQLMTPDHHPYVLMNFRGGVYDVAVLAHEVGHGVHQLLSNQQTFLNAHPPLVLAETASVFGEMMTFKALLRETSSVEMRRSLIARKVEDMLNTVVRQTAFYCFERKVHEARRAGELSPQQVGGFWMETQRESLGEAFIWDESYQNFWVYISHFIRSPFYVYAYAFGDCFVNALYSLYEEGYPNFEEAYLTFLSKGSTQPAEEAVKCFGFDGLTPAFWKKGLGVIQGYIDQLEQMV